MRILHGGTEHTIRAAADAEGHFTGEVWIDHLTRPAGAEDETGTDLSVQSAFFTPGAHTAWHTHPHGQVLHILAGEGRIGLRDGEVRTLRPGDTVVAEAGEWHWHGAAPGTSMRMFAVQRADADGAVVQWGEPVLDRDAGPAA